MSISGKATVSAVDLFEIVPPANRDGSPAAFSYEGFFRVRAETEDGHAVELRVVVDLDKGTFIGKAPYAVGDTLSLSVT